MKWPSTHSLSSGNFSGLPFQEMSWEATNCFCSLVAYVPVDDPLFERSVLLAATVLFWTHCMKLPGVDSLDSLGDVFLKVRLLAVLLAMSDASS
jgi:hypothetical protein